MRWTIGRIIGRKAESSSASEPSHGGPGGGDHQIIFPTGLHPRRVGFPRLVELVSHNGWFLHMPRIYSKGSQRTSRHTRRDRRTDTCSMQSLRVRRTWRRRRCQTNACSSALFFPQVSSACGVRFRCWRGESPLKLKIRWASGPGVSDLACPWERKGRPICDLVV